MDVTVSPQSLKIGDELPAKEWTVRFRRGWSTDDWKDNVHRGDGITRYGYKDGLIEGDHLVTLLVEVMVAFFGEDWYGYGTISGKLLPVYGGDRLRTRCVLTGLEPESDRVRAHFDAELVKENGDKAVVGTASCLLPAGFPAPA